MTVGLYRMLELGRINCTLAYAGQLGLAIQDPKERLNPIIIKFRRTGEYAEIFDRWESDGGAQIMRLKEQRGLR